MVCSLTMVHTVYSLINQPITALWFFQGLLLQLLSDAVVLTQSLLCLEGATGRGKVHSYTIKGMQPHNCSALDYSNLSSPPRGIGVHMHHSSYDVMQSCSTAFYTGEGCFALSMHPEQYPPWKDGKRNAYKSQYIDSAKPTA